jgi:hypothetical protein
MSLHRRGVTEMNFGLHAGARGDRKQFAEIYCGMSFAQARGDRKRSPKFIAA